jgi:hypothetical protein
MSQQPQPAYAPPPFVVMQVPQSNGLGVFGFFVALIGLFVPTGILAMLGLVLSLAAIGRAPRGFATMGVILGLIGTIFWLAVMGIAILAVVVGALGVAIFAAVGFVLTQPEVVEVTTDMVNLAIAVEEHRQDNDQAMPAEIGVLALGVSARTDPWGTAYRLVPADEDPGFDVISAGPDAAFDNDDDIRLSKLDRLWERAFDDFGEKMEEFGERMEKIDQHRHGHHIAFTCRGDAGQTMCGKEHEQAHDYASKYESKAREHAEEPVEPWPAELPKNGDGQQPASGQQAPSKAPQRLSDDKPDSPAASSSPTPSSSSKR